MTDREKVIGHLNDCLEASKPENTWVFVRKVIVGDAIALLKEQEPVKPQLSISGMWYECPVCHRHLTKDIDNYCARCGRSVKWE